MKNFFRSLFVNLIPPIASVQLPLIAISKRNNLFNHTFLFLGCLFLAAACNDGMVADPIEPDPCENASRHGRPIIEMPHNEGYFVEEVFEVDDNVPIKVRFTPDDECGIIERVKVELLYQNGMVEEVFLDALLNAETEEYFEVQYPAKKTGLFTLKATVSKDDGSPERTHTTQFLVQEKYCGTLINIMSPYEGEVVRVGQAYEIKFKFEEKDWCPGSGNAFVNIMKLNTNTGLQPYLTIWDDKVLWDTSYGAKTHTFSIPGIYMIFAYTKNDGEVYDSAIHTFHVSG